MDLKTLKTLDVKEKRVLVRVDFNVPLDEQGQVTDDSRIKAALPTIKYLVEQMAKVILISHLGRPKGKVVEKLRLDSVAGRLGELLGKRVIKVDDCIGLGVAQSVKGLQAGEVLLLENLRFYAQEVENDQDFAKELASLAELYVNDAFGTAHRAHASTVGVANYLPAAAGLLMEKEVRVLEGLLSAPEHPFLAVLGGAKVRDKIGVLKSLVNMVDTILLGGGMANTFLKAKGCELGASLVDEESVGFAAEFLELATKQGVQVELPIDLVIAPEDRSSAQVVSADKIPSGWCALDIGPETAEHYAGLIKEGKTAFWNGPMGVFEDERFAQGSKRVAQAMGARGLTSIVGGGDSLALLGKYGLNGQVTHASTGGGASLEFLEGKKLPGLAMLAE